jgi:hypothetical protein
MPSILGLFERIPSSGIILYLDKVYTRAVVAISHPFSMVEALL